MTTKVKTAALAVYLKSIKKHCIKIQMLTLEQQCHILYYGTCTSACEKQAKAELFSQTQEMLPHSGPNTSMKHSHDKIPNNQAERRQDKLRFIA
ncbi:hypothetical protein FKM82_006987 [Ascaphus truei]